MTYKWIFRFKIEKVKTIFSAEKRIWQRFEIKGTLDRKVGSGRFRASTIKYDQMLEFAILKDRKKTFVDNKKYFFL